jgi:hypothetical protein
MELVPVYQVRPFLGPLVDGDAYETLALNQAVLSMGKNV